MTSHHSRLARTLTVTLLVVFQAGAAIHPAPPGPPSVLDPRLELRLFADSDLIVTPVGMAVDTGNRLFVVESHTHSPPRNYDGPESDRIKILEDRDGDGQADGARIFAEGLEDAMNLAFSPEGDLFVVHRTGVVVLRDRDDDGVSESRESILQLRTTQTYDHSCLLGIAISPHAWLHISRGNVGGHPYSIVGSDGSTVSGYADGGNIVRCRADGSQVQEIATGFWNPFAMDFDAAGRLLCVDNDPDSRGPNRLVHVIPGGDYGFRSLHGPGGLHPHDAWDGELPGTLPMIAGTGEAPAGVLDADRAALPVDYRGNILVTGWGSHTIERFVTRPQGASMRAGRSVIVQGGEDFRPVAIAAGQDGAVLFTDWVRKDYPNHGEGRIWRLATRSDVPVLRPRKPFAQARADEGKARIDSLLAHDPAATWAELRSALVSDDPFLVSAAVEAFSRPEHGERRRKLLEHPGARLRRAAALAERRAGGAPPPAEVERLLVDPDPELRRLALIWIGETRSRALLGAMDRAVSGDDVPDYVLESYLATRLLFTPGLERAIEQQTPGFRLDHSPDDELLRAWLGDPERPVRLRALAAARLRHPDRPATLELLLELLETTESRLRREAVRTLAAAANARATSALEAIAMDPGQPSDLRADAIVGMARRPPATLARLLPLLETREPYVQLEAVRALARATEQREVLDALAARFADLARTGRFPRVREQLAFVLDAARIGPPGDSRAGGPRRPGDTETWMRRLASGGDPDSGRRLFAHPSVDCIRCHRMGGRGGPVAPDLSRAGGAKTREELIEAILFPSRDIPLQYQTHVLITRDGQTYTGIQFHYRDGGRTVSILLEDGTERRFPLSGLLRYSAANTSLMPEGLERSMSVADLRDLVAFLGGLR